MNQDELNMTSADWEAKKQRDLASLRIKHKLDRDQLKTLLRRITDIGVEPTQGFANMQASVELKVSSEKKDECGICMNAKPEMAALPCGHQSMCSKCSVHFQICPICREPITSFVRIFKC